MRYIPFLDEQIIRAACESEEETSSAISIGAKFCIRAFTLPDCVTNPLAVSTFCATTIILARSRKFKGRSGTRAFSIKDDFQNELTAACNDGYEPIPINGYVRKSEKNKANTVSYSEESSLQQVKLQEVQDLSDRLREEASLILTDVEKMILYEMDGIIRISALAKRFGLKRAEAVSIANNIYCKLATISITIN